jgi:hypothetical protein
VEGERWEFAKKTTVTGIVGTPWSAVKEKNENPLIFFTGCPAEGLAPRLGPLVVLFVAAFALLLASFPARNSNLWGPGLEGLLALEEGEVDEARRCFRLALALWKDKATAAAGAGLDFNADFRGPSNLPE